MQGADENFFSHTTHMCYVMYILTYTHIHDDVDDDFSVEEIKMEIFLMMYVIHARCVCMSVLIYARLLRIIFFSFQSPIFIICNLLTFYQWLIT